MAHMVYWFMFVVSFTVFGETPFDRNSAVRFSWENYQDAVQRHIKKQHLETTPREKTAYTEALPVDKLDFTQLPTLKGETQLNELFYRVRDERFISSNDPSDSLRRSTWLYPMDGCWARAALAGQRIEKWAQTRPAKLFAFGNLKVKTENAKEGYVTWWYHVVPIYRVESGGVFVFDPAMNAQAPMPVAKWIESMGDPKIIKGSLCNPYTYGPNSACYTGDAQSEKYALKDQEMYLSSEWDNLVQLERNPSSELGEHPPWLQKLEIQARLTSPRN